MKTQWVCEMVDVICADCGQPNGYKVSKGMSNSFKRRGIVPRCAECAKKAIQSKRGPARKRNA